MPNCRKLWNIWFITYVIVINTYLTYISIWSYINFKYQASDLAYGVNWNLDIIHIILGCINVAIGLVPVIVVTNIIRTGNLANDAFVIGEQTDVFVFDIDNRGKGTVYPVNRHPSCFCSNRILKLMYMELPPLSYLLQVCVAYCHLIPVPFMEAEQIHNRVYPHKRMWHTDLNIFFDPDRQHYKIVDEQMKYSKPMSLAYFNLAFSLFILSIQYSRVFWKVSRTFTMLFSFVFQALSSHMLVEYCLISVLIKIAVNPSFVPVEQRLKIHSYLVLCLSVLANIVLILSFMCVFHFGILQYADSSIHRNRKNRRALLLSSQQMVAANNVEIPPAFSPCVSENNYSDNSVEPVFSKNHFVHMLGIVSVAIAVGLKLPIIYQSFIHFYQTTSDSLTIVNMLISILFLCIWCITWFAFILRRTWKFEIKTELKPNTGHMNGNSALTGSPNIQLNQISNSFLLNAKSSDLNLSKDTMPMNRNIGGLDGCSDETDMSSKLSSNNYVFLQSVRNGQMYFDVNGHPSLMRNPIYLPYGTNSIGGHNAGVVYANDDTINNRSPQNDEPLGSEHSFNSNKSKSVFESMPPVLPNFDENRYRHFNQNSSAIERMIPRYLRNPSLDGSLPYSMPNEFVISTLGNNPMTYTLDNSFPNFQRVNRQNGPTMNSRISDKYSTINLPGKPTTEQFDYYMTNNDDDGSTKRAPMMGDVKFNATKSPVIFPTVDENQTDNVACDSDALLPKGIDADTPVSAMLHNHEPRNNSTANPGPTDRMCSQV